MNKTIKQTVLNVLRENTGMTVKIQELIDRVVAEIGKTPTIGTIRVYIAHLRNEGHDVRTTRPGGYTFFAKNNEEAIAGKDSAVEVVTTPVRYEETEKTLEETLSDVTEKFDESFNGK
jgi:hypothetical protein